MKKLFLSLLLVLSIPVAQAMQLWVGAADDEQELVRQGLLPFNGDPNGVDKHGNNALQYLLASAPNVNECRKKFKAFVKTGVRCDTENKLDTSPLDMAIQMVYPAERFTLCGPIIESLYSRSFINEITKALQEVQSARQLTRETLAINGLPVDALTQLVCEYASLNNRSEEIRYIRKHSRRNAYNACRIHCLIARKNCILKYYVIKPTLPAITMMLASLIGLALSN